MYHAVCTINKINVMYIAIHTLNAINALFCYYLHEKKQQCRLCASQLKFIKLDYQVTFNLLLP